MGKGKGLWKRHRGADMIHRSGDGGVTTITLDRPEARNALREAELRELGESLDTVESPVVYLTGADGCFCAGADLGSVRSLADHEEAREFSRLGQQVATSITDHEAVVVAGIDGPARGGGVELALACDLRVATPRATFAETGVDLGLFGAWGGTVRLPEVVGLGAALEIALTGRVLDAEEALRLGLITQVRDDPSTVATDLARANEFALGAIKRLVRDRSAVGDRERLEAEAFADLVERGPSLPD